jgi:hypothetical protein
MPPGLILLDRPQQVGTPRQWFLQNQDLKYPLLVPRAGHNQPPAGTDRASAAQFQDSTGEFRCRRKVEGKGTQWDDSGRGHHEETTPNVVSARAARRSS